MSSEKNQNLFQFANLLLNVLIFSIASTESLSIYEQCQNEDHCYWISYSITNPIPSIGIYEDPLNANITIYFGDVFDSARIVPRFIYLAGIQLQNVVIQTETQVVSSLLSDARFAVGVAGNIGSFYSDQETFFKFVANFSSKGNPGQDTINTFIDYKMNELPLITSLNNSLVLMFFETTDNFLGADAFWSSGEILFKIYTALNDTCYGKEDNFGYQCANNIQTIGTMEDSSFDSSVISLGTKLELNQNILSNPLTIGFPFKFYDFTYSQLYVSPKGFITFNSLSGIGCCSGDEIPSVSQPNGIIAVFWSNITTPTIYYRSTGISPQRKFTILFSNVTIANSKKLSNFEVILYENNYIDMLYSNLEVPWDFPNVSIGIESPNGTDGLQFYHGVAPSLTRTPLSVRFRVIPNSNLSSFKFTLSLKAPTTGEIVIASTTYSVNQITSGFIATTEASLNFSGELGTNPKVAALAVVLFGIIIVNIIIACIFIFHKKKE